MVDVADIYNDTDIQSQEVIIQEHAVMVKRIAHHLIGRLPNTVQLEDLIQSGMIGLLDAAKNFDSSKGASFVTYASIRIRGSMLDEVRKNDWQPRSVYKNSRMLTAAIKAIENRYGRDAKDHEVAEELGVTIDEYHQLLLSVNTGQLYGYDDLGVSDDVMKNGLVPQVDEPLANLQHDDFNQQLSDVIDSIPEREQLVMSLYYNDELNLKEIGAILGVSESRVCQIHSQAITRIKARLMD